MNHQLLLSTSTPAGHRSKAFVGLAGLGTLTRCLRLPVFDFLSVYIAFVLVVHVVGSGGPSLEGGGDASSFWFHDIRPVGFFVQYTMRASQCGSGWVGDGFLPIGFSWVSRSETGNGTSQKE